jgi:hypothetical protein
MADETTESLEEWRSMVKGTFGVTRFGEKGERSNDRVPAGATFFITATERQRNQTQVRDKRDDPFTNGAFVRVDGDGTVKDPTAKGREDDDLLKLLESRQDHFAAQVKKIDEKMTMHRLYRLAREHGIGDRKIEVLSKRLKELDPNAALAGDRLAVGAEDPNAGNADGGGKDMAIAAAIGDS